jgi:hypothetical protein
MVTEESKQFFCFLLGGDRAGGKGMCGRFMSPALETQSMREKFSLSEYFNFLFAYLVITYYSLQFLSNGDTK